MSKKSAGLLMVRRRREDLEVFLVHPGGPFWAKKDAGSWSIPKGEYMPGEVPFEVAKREFQEETGFKATGEFIPLTPRKQPGGKIITAWVFEGDCDASAIKSNTSAFWQATGISRSGSSGLVLHVGCEGENSKRAIRLP
jgi:predicted NUDIX family NTP pyrophosphohydrolase